jgi:hypothetical protein
MISHCARRRLGGVSHAQVLRELVAREADALRERCRPRFGPFRSAASARRARRPTCDDMAGGAYRLLLLDEDDVRRAAELEAGTRIFPWASRMRR